jgi:hypothetical protein
MWRIKRKVLRMLMKICWPSFSRISRVYPIGQNSPEDVFITSYPKSGVTWVQYLISGIVYGVDPSRVRDQVVQRLVPDIHYLETYHRWQTPMFFKSHSLPAPAFRRVIWLLRDGRDAMVSYAKWYEAFHSRSLDLKEAIREGKGLFPCKWNDFVDAWHQNPYSSDILLVRYEDIHSDAGRELKRMTDFAGYDYSLDECRSVAEKATFSKMRTREQKSGWDYAGWPEDKYFVRRGKVGSFRDEMDPDVLKLFMEEAGDSLRACGYE